MKQPLTNKQRDILMCIAKKISTHGYQPSYREIARKFGFSSPGAVTGHLAAAEKKGACKRVASRAVQFDWRKYL